MPYLEVAGSNSDWKSTGIPHHSNDTCHTQAATRPQMCAELGPGTPTAPPREWPVTCTRQAQMAAAAAAHGVLFSCLDVGSGWVADAAQGARHAAPQAVPLLATEMVRTHFSDRKKMGS